jgi:hypothetical protein
VSVAHSHHWAKAGVPHKGWTSDYVTDIEDATHTCEMCGKEQIRYVHALSHPDHHSLDVGCICAERMTEDYFGPKDREATLKNRTARRSKWLTRRWRVSAKGNEFINVNGRNLGVIPDSRGFGWRYRIEDSFSAKRYESSDLAKLAMFDALYPSKAR